MFSNRRPNDLGIKSGRLANCPNRHNCVSSQTEDRDHFIAPLNFGSNPAYAMERLKILVGGVDGATIINCNNYYIYAECKTSILGFIDDLEFYWSPIDKVCHVRSASRVGYSDLGKNRKRIEKIRQKLTTIIMEQDKEIVT